MLIDMSRILATLASLGATLVMVAAGPAHADGPVVVASPPGYTGPEIYGTWAKTGEVATVLVYSTADPRWGAKRLVAQWNEGGGVQMVFTSTPCQGCITISQARSLDNLGEALISATDGVIQHCAITMNMSRFMPNWAAGRRSMLAHELGHCLGLGHSTRENTAVGTMSGLDGPTWRDLEWIEQLYGQPAAM